MPLAFSASLHIIGLGTCALGYQLQALVVQKPFSVTVLFVFRGSQMHLVHTYVLHVITRPRFQWSKNGPERNVRFCADVYLIVNVGGGLRCALLLCYLSSSIGVFLSHCFLCFLLSVYPSCKRMVVDYCAVDSFQWRPLRLTITVLCTS